MARDFDGVNDRLDFGSDASIDEGGTFGDQITIALHFQSDSFAGSGPRTLVAKDRRTASWSLNHRSASFGGNLRFAHQWSGGLGEWIGTTDLSASASALRHVVLVYDAGNVANNAEIYLDGTSDSPTEASAPSGTRTADDAASLVAGEEGGGASDFDGRILCLQYDNFLATAENVNRHRWWGTLRGGPSTAKVWHPFWTNRLTNTGTATADGTATGTTMSSLPRVERCWAAMMGCGR